ncbi:hypothetical protein A33M_2747 [Rhodovulum sp. PH10]|nr:hypothetical protein A33M_2747 [Rhodovulum sp. PH10]
MSACRRADDNPGETSLCSPRAGDSAAPTSTRRSSTRRHREPGAPCRHTP